MNHIFVAISRLEVRCFLRRIMILFGFILFTPLLWSQPQASESLLRAIRASESRSLSDTATVRVLNQLSYLYDGYKTDSALLLATKACEMASSLADKRGEARAYINIGNIKETKGLYDAALEAHFRGVAIAKSIPDNFLLARAYNGIGIVYSDQGKFQEALKAYLQSLSIYEALADTINISRALNNIAIVHQNLQHFDNAMQYYRRSFTLAVAQHDSKSTIVAAGNLGQMYVLRKQYDSALIFLQQSYTISQEVGDKHSMAARLNDIGELLQVQGNYKDALQYMTESLRLKEEMGESTYIINSLSAIATVLAAAGRAQEGLIYARRSVDSAEKMGAKTLLQTSLEALVTVYDSLGRHREALREYRKLSELRNALLSEESLKKSMQLQAQYESEKKDKQILRLTKDQELQETTRQMLLALGVVLLAALAALYSRYRLKASSERALQEHNAEILCQQLLLETQAADIQTANTALHEKNLALQHQQEILEEQAREIEIANTSLQEKNFELESLNNEKNEFLGIAAHDLKNPLTHIMMASGTATRYYDRMTDNDIQEQFHSIGNVAGRMQEIIANLLDINAIERGGLTLNIASFDISPKLKGIVNDYITSAGEKHITFHCEASSAVTVVADEQAVMQVLDNLVSNAVKYSPHGKKIFVRLSASDRAVRVEICDEGPGLSEEDMKKLFGKFARLSARPTAGEHSTGLGLSIVKKLVEAMNGKVWCESELGRGASFIVELPTASFDDIYA
jgi:signal transduction histidine kinase/tetratricopeptide (TPR) repeat protein